ncbi:hypothetical protein [Pinirhizobacter soli]|uniref:hypothetical protein n=1 Tax=Pinirhizobacter soli TaxID=2786953 RepID=UPI00202A7361|nr:hypothetical protein [Pinirhizobacter soli]
MAQGLMNKGSSFSVAIALFALLAAPAAAATSSLWCKVNPTEKGVADAMELPVTSFHKVKDQSRAAGIVGKASYKAISWRVAGSLLGEDVGRKGSFILAKYTQPKWIGAEELTKADASVEYSASNRALYLYNFSLSNNDDGFENIIVLIDTDKPVSSVSVACMSAA